MAQLRNSPAVPLFMPVLCYGLGIIFGRSAISMNIWIALMLICIFASAISSFYGRKFRHITYTLILLSFFCFGGFRYVQSYYCYSDDHIIRYCQGDGLNIANIRGEVVSQPKLRLSSGALSEYDFMNPKGMSLEFLCTAIFVNDSWQEVTGKIYVYTNEPALEIAEGQILELSGRLYSRKSAESRARYYARARRIITACSVDHNEQIKIVSNDSANHGFKHYLAGIRENLQRRLGFDKYRNETEADSLFAALLLGERGGISTDTKEAFVAGGTMHFLSLSGLHVGMLTGLIWLLVRPFRISRFWHGIIPALFIILYMLVVPARAPAVRAGIIFIFFCIGYISRRKSSPVNLLALSAFLILIFRPLDIFNAGFQLSYGIVLALVIITPPVFMEIFRDPDKIRLVDYYEMPLLDDRPWYLRQISFLKKIVSTMAIVSIVAWIVSLPLIAWHFNRIAWLAPFNSVIMSVPVSIAMLFGILKIIISLVLPFYFGVLEPFLNLPGEFLLWLAKTLASIPHTSENVSTIPVWLFILYLSILILNLIFAFYKKYKYLRWAACGMILCLIIFVILVPFRNNSDKLKVHVLHAGHGCVVIAEIPGGHTLMYDCGSYDNFSLGEYTIVPHLRKLGCNYIDAAIISHSDMDHYSALPDVSNRIRVGKLFVPIGFGRYFTASDYTFMELMEDKCHSIDYLAAGDCIIGNETYIDVIWPEDADYDSPNAGSMAVKIISKDKSVLLCGDITPEVMTQLLENEVDLSADYLLLPHHGEISEVLQDFVDAVSPEGMILSARTPSETKWEMLSELCPNLLRPTPGNPVVIE